MHAKDPVVNVKSSVDNGNTPQKPSLHKTCQSLQNVEVGHYTEEAEQEVKLVKEEGNKHTKR